MPKIGEADVHCFNQVDLLKSARPRCTLLPATPDYETARKSYWSKQQANTTPYCIYQPQDAQDVAIALEILQKTQCPFGIRSGGHGRLAGESSISAGVLIDLSCLKKLQLSEDKSVCHVGPGHRWVDVYTYLNPLGLTAVGGRSSSVGVGGFCISGQHLVS